MSNSDMNHRNHSEPESGCCCQSHGTAEIYTIPEEETCCQSRNRSHSEPEEGCRCQSHETDEVYAIPEEETCCQSRNRAHSEPEEGCRCQSHETDEAYAIPEEETCCQSRNRAHSEPEEGCRCQSRRRSRSGGSSIDGIQNPQTLDAIAYHKKKGRVILAMYETRPWAHGHKQLYQLQEKLNAYASYVLDGEMEEDFPEFQNQQVHIQLRTVEEPSDRAMEFVHQARKQLELQDITFEVIRISSVEDESELIED